MDLKWSFSNNYFVKLSFYNTPCFNMDSDITLWSCSVVAPHFFTWYFTKELFVCKIVPLQHDSHL